MLRAHSLQFSTVVGPIQRRKLSIQFVAIPEGFVAFPHFSPLFPLFPTFFQPFTTFPTFYLFSVTHTTQFRQNFSHFSLFATIRHFSQLFPNLHRQEHHFSPLFAFPTRLHLRGDGVTGHEIESGKQYYLQRRYINLFIYDTLDAGSNLSPSSLTSTS